MTRSSPLAGSRNAAVGFNAGTKTPRAVAPR